MSNFIKSRLLESVSRMLGDEYKAINEAPSDIDPEGTSPDLQAEPEAQGLVPVEPVTEPTMDDTAEVTQETDAEIETTEPAQSNEFVSKEVFNKVVEAMSNMKSAMEVLASEVINLKKKNDSIVAILNKVNDKFVSIDKDELQDDKAFAELSAKINTQTAAPIKETAIVPTGVAARCTDILDSTYKVSDFNESAPIVAQPKTELGEMLLQYQSKKSANGVANEAIHAADILG